VSDTYKLPGSQPEVVDVVDTPLVELWIVGQFQVMCLVHQL
jgi:hypothetical protein